MSKTIANNRNDSPCYRCDRRKAECHSTCEDYISWSEELSKSRDEYNRRVRIERGLDEADIRRGQGVHYCGYFGPRKYQKRNNYADRKWI